MPPVSVPCPSCASPIYLADRECVSCRANVPRGLRHALEARLEASNSDYRERKQRVRSASSVLLVIALLYLGVGTLLFFVRRSAELAPSHEGSIEDAAALFESYASGVVLLACFWASKRAPLAAIATGLVLWTSGQVALFAASPRSFLTAFLSAGGVGVLFAKLIIFVLLARGAIAALQLRSFRDRSG